MRKGMKKGVMKKLAATVLAVAMIFTSVDMGWAMVAQAEGPQTVITDAELVAQNYAGSLTDEEKAILNSGMVTSDAYTIAQPTDSSLVTIDSDNKKIYAKNFVDGNFAWVAETAEIKVGDSVVEGPIQLVADTATPGQTTASFTTNEQGYKVDVTYALYIDVDKATQEMYLNVPYYMADAMNNMANSIMKSTSSMNMLIRFAPEMKKYVDGTFLVQFTGECKRVVESWINQADTYNKSLLAVTVEDGGYATAVSKVANILEHGADYKEVAVDTYTDNNYLITDVGVSAVAPDEVSMLAEVNEKLEAAATSPWALLDLEEKLVEDSKSILAAGKDDADYTAFDAAVTAAIGKSSLHVTAATPDVTTDTEVTLNSTLLADTVTISASVNRYNVEVEIQADVIDFVNGNNVVTSLNAGKMTLDFASDTAAADVLQAIQDNGVETVTVNAWNALNGGLYAIDTVNYDRTATTLPATLTEDVKYVVKYTPKELTVDYTDETMTDETVPYGGYITFPLYVNGEGEDKSYEYTVDGVIYEQGENFRVVENIAVSRELGKAKTGVRVYDIIEDQYGSTLSEKELAILKNLDSPYIYVRMAGEDLVNLTGDTVTVREYNAGNGMYWKPVKIEVMDGSTVVQTIPASELADGTADITASAYTEAQIVYQLEVDVPVSEVKDAMNLPDALAKEAKQQLADMGSLVGFESDIDQITYGLLDLVGPRLNADSQAAIKVIADNCCEADGVLKLSTIIDAYKALTTDSAKLSYYYGNNTYGVIKNQIQLVADSLAVIVADPALPELLKSLGYEEYIEKLDGASEKINQLTAKFPAKNTEINTSSETYNALVNALVASGTTKTYSSADKLYLDTTFIKAASTRATVSVTVQIVNGAGQVTGTETYSSTFPKDTGITAGELADYTAKVTEFETALGVDKAHYSCTTTGSFPTADTALTGNSTVVYTWAPKTYTVKIDGEADQSFKYSGNMEIILPGTGDASFRYEYKIGNETVKVGTTDGKYSFDAEKFAAAFGSETTYTITRVKIDVARETVLNLIKKLNGLADESGMSFVPYEDAQGNISVVLRMNPLGTGFTGSLTDAAYELLVNQTYLGLGDGALKENGIHLNAVVDMILDSGISSKDIYAMIDENGDIKENAQSKVADKTLIVDAAAGITNTTDLGGFLMETTFSLDPNGPKMPLYITLQDFDQNASQYASVRKTLATIDPYAEIIFDNGTANAIVTVPEKAHEAIIAAMLIEGAVDINQYENPSLVEIVDYVRSTVEDPITDTAVTADTIINTAKELGVTQDLTSYENMINNVLRGIRALVDDKLENGELESTNTVGQADDTYNGKATVPVDAVLDVISTNMSEDQQQMLDGVTELLADDSKEIIIPAKVQLTNCNTAYEALVIDPNAAKTINMVDLTTDLSAVASGITGNSIIVLVGDVADAVTTNNQVLLDLNGYSMAGLTANGTTLVTDSVLDTAKAGTITSVSGGVKLTAGTYGSDVTAYLPDGYVQNNGVVSNKYFTVEQDASGNTTVKLDADFMNTDDPVAAKTLAFDIAVDLLMNVYTFGGLSVDGNEIYKVALDDAIQYVNDVKANGAVATGKDVVSTLIEEINCVGVETFANTLIADILDFAAIKDAIENDTAVAEYAVTSNPWDVTVEKATAGDYLTVNLGTGADRSSKLTLVVAGSDEDKADLAAFVDELNSVFTTKDVTVDLTDLSYSAEEGFQFEAGADINLTVDLSQKDYLTVVGVILAYGNNDTALADEVKAYLNDGVNTDLVAAIEDSTSAEIIKAVKSARNVAFADMLTALNITLTDSTVADLADLYADTLDIGAILINNLELTGGSRTLESFKTAFGTYGITKENWKKMDIQLKLILAEENSVGYPDATIGTPTIANAQLVKGLVADEENGLIYIDVAVEGISWNQFKQAVDFDIQNATAASTTYEPTSQGTLVCTDDTIKITAYNPEQMLDPVKATKTYRIIVVGDTNKDGKSTVSDARLINRYNVDDASALAVMTDGPQKAADVNKDGGISVSDVRKLQRKYVDYTNYMSSYR